MNETIEVEPLTKRALIERGLDALPPADTNVTVAHHAGGGVSQVNLPQVIEIAKHMAASGEAVPPHCRGNVGICLRVTFQAVEWQMSPFQVADNSYVVNSRLAYMSQLIHAIVESRAPLQHRLACDYDGEGSTRTCTVRGLFTTGDIREYTTPMIKDIKVKNSPLWTADPDQQLFYYASRSWARKWVPDVLMGVYTKEEMADHKFEAEAESGLQARLSSAAKSIDGHKEGHAHDELSKIDGGKTIDHDPNDKQAHDKAAAKAKPEKAGKTAKKSDKKSADDRPAVVDDPREAEVTPTSVKAWKPYCRAWLNEATTAEEINTRWGTERRLRNTLGVTADDRKDIEDLKAERLAELK